MADGSYEALAAALRLLGEEMTKRKTRDADERLERYRDDLNAIPYGSENDCPYCLKDEQSLGLAALVVELNALNKWLEGVKPERGLDSTDLNDYFGMRGREE